MQAEALISCTWSSCKAHSEGKMLSKKKKIKCKPAKYKNDAVLPHQALSAQTEMHFKWSFHPWRTFSALMSQCVLPLVI